MNELITKIKALINVLPEDNDDYPDNGIYRIIQDKIEDVENEIYRIENPKPMDAFVIQGDYIEEDDDDVFWSNKDGWVDFDSATILQTSQLPYIHLPMGSKFIAYLNKEKKIIERKSLTTPQ